MKTMIFSGLILLAIPMAGLAETTPDHRQTKQDKDGTIVVTGVRLEDTERALKNCIAQKCPPDKDIAASLAHAENQFVAGDYKGARRTLLAARGRDRRYAKQFPTAVAGLVRANARVASHLGEGEAYQLGTIDIVDALKAGLPDTDPRILYARVEVGDMYARLGSYEAAQGAYENVIARARALGLARAEALAMLHLASFYSASSLGTGKVDNNAKRIIEELTAKKDPVFTPYAQAAKFLLARMLTRQGDPSIADKLIAQLKDYPPTEKPVLVYSPRIADITNNGRDRDSYLAGASLTLDVPIIYDLKQISTRDFDDQWVDISFYVAPDGHVNDAGVIRQSKSLDEDYWVKKLVQAVSARRYLPLKLDPTDPGILRVERYTLTSLWTSRPGTKVRERDPDGRIEVLDLSVDTPPTKVTASN